MSEWEFYKSIGICPQCQKNTIFDNECTCLDCREKKRIYYNENLKTKERLEKKTKRNMDRYYQLKGKGLCVDCGKREVKKGKVTCDYCLAIRRNRNKKRYNEKITMSRQCRVENGICRNCLNPVYKNFKLCKEHYNALLEVGFRNRKFRNDEFAKGVIT